MADGGSEVVMIYPDMHRSMPDRIDHPPTDGHWKVMISELSWAGDVSHMLWVISPLLMGF